MAGRNREIKLLLQWLNVAIQCLSGTEKGHLHPKYIILFKFSCLFV